MIKKVFFLLFVCSYLSAQQVEQLLAKASIEDGYGYFVFSDASCWKVLSLQPRWRSFSEWWNNMEIVSEKYLSPLSEWHPGTYVEIYLKSEPLDCEAEASNQQALKQYSHLLFHSQTGHILFATPLHPAECISLLFEEAYKKGHTEGVRESKLLEYQRGYNQGYRAGCDSRH